MIDEIAKRLAKNQVRNPKTYILGFIIVTLIAIPGIFMLVGNVEASLEEVLPDSVESVQTMNDARTQYSADMLHVVMSGPSDITQAQEYAQELAQRIESTPLVVAVPNVFETNHDQTLAVMDIQTDTGTHTDNINQVLQDIQLAIQATDNPGVHTEITGFAAIDQATFQTIMSDFLLITGFAMTLILLVVYSVFRSIKFTLIPMAAVMVALITTMGVTGYLNITITVVTMVAAAMILGLGIDFGIHTIHTFKEYNKKHNKQDAVQKTVQELFRAQLAASLTTSAGFLALGFGVLPAMANLGLVLAIGILTTFLAATMLLPPILTLT